MERSLWTAVTGMAANEITLDTIANNLANINTTAFKASQASFQDMLYTVLAAPGSQSGEGEIPNGIQIGHGTRVSEVSRHFEQGSLRESGGDLDLAIEGGGFFEVTLPDGTSAYTRDGSFRVNGSGEVVTSDGYAVLGFDTIDDGTTEITIASDGAFSTVVNSALVPKAQITLTLFTNPEGLRSVGHNLYKTTTSSGEAQSGIVPGENGAGFLAQRFLESSNVNTARELVNMIFAQRAYEATSKVIQASDQMMQLANNMAR